MSEKDRAGKGDETRATVGVAAQRAQSAVRRMTGGQALVESLKIQGVDVLFGLPGVQLDGAFARFRPPEIVIR